MIKEKIKQLKQKYQSSILACDIQDQDFEYYDKIGESEALLALDNIEFFLQEIEKDLKQDQVMARHALSGKFGADSLIELK